jgi:hypothetical protein
MLRCDWIDCFNQGCFFDGVRDTVLNGVGRKNTNKVIYRFVFLCPTHFYLAVGALAQQWRPENREAERLRTSERQDLEILKDRHRRATAVFSQVATKEN